MYPDLLVAVTVAMAVVWLGRHGSHLSSPPQVRLPAKVGTETLVWGRKTRPIENEEKSCMRRSSSSWSWRW